MRVVRRMTSRKNFLKNSKNKKLNFLANPLVMARCSLLGLSRAAATYLFFLHKQYKSFNDLYLRYITSVLERNFFTCRIVATCSLLVHGDCTNIYFICMDLSKS